MVRQLTDKDALSRFLGQDPYLHLYSIGDLDDFFWPYTKWFAWEVQGEIRSLFLLYTADENLPTLLALEEKDQEGSAILLAELKNTLPERFYAHLSPHLQNILQREYIAESRALSVKMRLERTAFQPVRDGGGETIVALDQEDLRRLNSFYDAAYPDNWFDPRMLETGQYVGIERYGKLVAVAGVHVYSPEWRVAALGNIATDPVQRGRGLGTAVTSRLCEQLFESVDFIGLNVSRENTAALRSYRKLGFAFHCEYMEWLVAGGKR